MYISYLVLYDRVYYYVLRRTCLPRNVHCTVSSWNLVVYFVPFCTMLSNRIPTMCAIGTHSTECACTDTA